jgi:DNA polymerase V
MNVGKPSNVYEGEFRGAPVYVCDYEYVDIYVDAAGLIQGWNQKKAIKENLPQTHASSLTSFETPTAEQRTIVASAVHASCDLFKSGYGYKKAGVIATCIMDQRESVQSMFEDSEAIEKEHKLTAAMDLINSSYGEGTLKLAVQGSGHIKSSKENQSPHYTTRWSELPKVSVK